MLLICFSFAPPSYYHTHTPEEIDADYRHVKELISHFDDKDDSFFRENRTKKEKHISIYSKPFLYAIKDIQKIDNNGNKHRISDKEKEPTKTIYK